MVLIFFEKLQLMHYLGNPMPLGEVVNLLGKSEKRSISIVDLSIF
jgi:hypothetical protein